MWLNCEHFLQVSLLNQDANIMFTFPFVSRDDCVQVPGTIFNRAFPKALNALVFTSLNDEYVFCFKIIIQTTLIIPEINYFASSQLLTTSTAMLMIPIYTFL